VNDRAAPLLTMGAVVKRTGIPAETIRAWERRYGVPRPQRTPSGRRLYSEADLDVLRHLRARETGAAQVAAALAVQAAAPPLDDALARALRELDLPAARARLDELAALLSLDAWLGRVVWPAASLLERLSPEEGLLGRGLVRARLIRLLGAFECVGAPVLVGGLVGADLHALAVAALLAREGHPVLAVGEGTSAEVLARLAARLRAPAVVVEGAGLVDPLRGSAPLVAVVGAPAPLWAVRLPDEPAGAVALLRGRLATSARA
jgi:DNA-binding transcriptional MerR regulator